MQSVALAIMVFTSTIPPPPPVVGQQRVERPNTPPTGMRDPCGQSGCLTPVEAVTYAAHLAPKAGVAGIVEMTVRAVGIEKGRVFLNSELDYRHRNNLSVVLPLNQMSGFSADLSEAGLRDALVGKRIFARGTARRVRVDFIDDGGKPSGKYYDQVHMPLRVAGDLRVASR